MTETMPENKLADPTEVYLGMAYLHLPSGKVMITTPHPDEEHNCDQMGCGSIGPHVIQWCVSQSDYAKLEAEKDRWMAACHKHQDEQEALEQENAKLREFSKLSTTPQQTPSSRLR